ncbi:hypothetical protein B0O99DRAFT_653458 [Bisporella sp. PMI_857]|nr:hypothetical protein B0O99DRAFT_653458 [Bisporella sp. PMI_857]
MSGFLRTSTTLAVPPPHPALQSLSPRITEKRTNAALYVDISLLLKGPDSNESTSSSPAQSRQRTRSTSVPPTDLQPQVSSFAPVSSASVAKRSMPPHPAESPAKKQSKWSPEEDALIIDLRGGGMKWEDISKRLPGRSAISCRLHYQNYLERRSEWDEERKNKLARLYERFKPEMWSKVAEEMAVPWRAAEAMHWQLGEADMARRAGVVPFSLSNVDTPSPSRTSPPAATRGHSHSHSLPHAHPLPGTMRGPGPTTSHYSSQGNLGSIPRGNPSPSSRTIAARRDSTPRSVPPTSPGDGLALAAIGGGGTQMRGMQMLPSVAEMTTGVSPYATPAYATSGPPGGQIGGGYYTPGPVLPAIGMMGVDPRSDPKRRASPDIGSRETTRRRQ